MIERDHPVLSIGAQCRLLSIARSSFHHRPQGETELNLALMRRIDEQFLETPFYGVRQMTWHLRNEGHLVNEKRVRRLMRLMRLAPIYQRPNTSRPAKGHKTYPYLLRDLRVDRPDQDRSRRHHLPADATRLPLPDRGHGLGHEEGPGLAPLEHSRGGLLHRGPQRGDLSLRRARHHEHGAWSRHRSEWPCDARGRSSPPSPGPAT